MKRKIISRGITMFMLLALLLIIISSIIYIRPLLLDFEVEKISLDDRENKRAGEAGRLFDGVLMEKLPHFKYIRSFNHLFVAESRERELPNMAVDKCEVNQSDFKKFTQWEKGKELSGLLPPGFPYGWKFHSNTEKHLISGRLQAPVSGVSYYDAYVYCRAAGGRLPYSDEWVAIASGPQQRLYPWGRQFKRDGWPYLNPLLNAAQRCGLHNETDSAEALSDLGHNVSEWAQQRDQPTVATIHGGNAYNQPYELYSLNHLYRYAPSDYRSPYLGFRCVYEGKTPGQSPWGSPIKAIQLAARKYQTGVPAGAVIPGLIARLPTRQIDQVQRIFEQRRVSEEAPLALMKYEVSRAQYASFLADPLVRLGLYADAKEPVDHSYVPDNWEKQKENPELPVSRIDWWSAYAFAKWAGGRLPSADEWALAASSNGQFIYPWGHEFASSYTASIESNVKRAGLPGSFSMDKTSAGIFDMGGNLSEWTQSADLESGGYAIVIKGGNYKLPGKTSARIDFENRVPANYRSDSIGFRVAFTR